MMYSEARIENGQLVHSNVKIISQSELTSDCWMIQINGAKACTTCEYKNKPRLCGGMAIRKKLGVPEPITRKRK
jgi:hypothetical protein